MEQKCDCELNGGEHDPNLTFDTFSKDVAFIFIVFSTYIPISILMAQIAKFGMGMK
jgi:hypothetical protein